MLTESQAWRLIAERIANNEWYKFGLCREVENLRNEGEIEENVFDVMTARIDCLIDDALRHSWLFPSGEPDERVLLALFLSYLTNETQ